VTDVDAVEKEPMLRKVKRRTERSAYQHQEGADSLCARGCHCRAEGCAWA